MATVRESRGAAVRSDGRTGTRMALVRRCRNGQTDGAESAVCAVLPTCDNRLTLTTPARRRALAARTVLFGGRPWHLACCSGPVCAHAWHDIGARGSR